MELECRNDSLSRLQGQEDGAIQGHPLAFIPGVLPNISAISVSALG